MIVKHNHQCMLCTTSKTCFLFQSFSMLFAVCRSCYDQMLEDLDTYEVVDATCSFCERSVLSKKITGFDNSMFFTNIHICPDCFIKMQHIVESSQE